MSQTQERIAKFYKSYSEWIKAIPKIENELHVPHTDLGSWIDLLREKSMLFRSLYFEDEKLLSEVVYPLIDNPGQMTLEEANCFSRGNYELYKDTHCVDLLMFDDLGKIILDCQLKNHASVDEVVDTLHMLQVSTAFCLTAEKTAESCRYADQGAAYLGIFKEDLAQHPQYKKTRKSIIGLIYNSFFFKADLQHQTWQHDFVGLANYFDEFNHRMQDIAPYLTDEEKPFVSIRQLIAYVTLLDEFMTFHLRLKWDKSLAPLSLEEEAVVKKLTAECKKVLEPLVNLADPQTCLNEYCHLLYAQVLLGELGEEEYLKVLEKIYSWSEENKGDSQLYVSNQFLYHVVVASDLAHAVASSKLSQKEKNQRISSYFGKSLTYLESIPQAAYNEQLLKATTDFLIDMIPLVPPAADLPGKFTKLMFFQQTDSAIHNIMVDKIAENITLTVLNQKPELFISKGGYQTKEEVLSHKDEIIRFIREASLLHDTGKAPFWDLLNQQRRHLTPAEFDIIKLHSQVGYDILRLNPSLERFAEVALCHHKWYDGTQGYPKNADNVNSPDRIYIDIITLADSIDAGTDSLGRCYRAGKPFAMLLKELEEQKGTRYNPDLVSLISSSPSLKDNLVFIVTEGRKEVFSQIYQDYLTGYQA
jgi:hypothetical protein